MGCGSSSASAPGRFDDDEEMLMDGKRMVMDKKTGEWVEVDGGKDIDDKEDDCFAFADDGPQFMSVRPWIGAIAEPANHNEVDSSVPDTQYTLEYVYGYRCADSRQNCYFNAEGAAVYMTAALGVILDPATNTQKFFGGGEVDNTAKNVANDMNHHTDDIMALSLCPQRQVAVTGQVGSKPTIFKWNANTGEKICRMKLSKGARGISAVAVNGEGWVAGSDLSNDHNVYCYDNSGNVVFKERGGPDKIHDIAWDVSPGSKRFCSAGVKHIYFWDAAKPNGDKDKGLFSGNPQTSFSCAAFDDQGVCYTGGSNGKIYMWGGDDGRTCQGTLDFHKKNYFVCAMRFVNGKLFSGGKDGKVNCIDTTSKTVTSCVQFGGLVRSIDYDKDSLLVGQRDGTISTVKLDGSDKKDIMMSHSDGEVWGLAQNAAGHIVTSADDNKVMTWDPSSRTSAAVNKVSDRKDNIKRGASTLSRKPDSQQARAVAVNESFLAVGCNDGKVSIRTAADTATEVQLLTDSKEWIEVMAFSPNNNYLAVGSHDNRIYVYSTADWSLVGTCRGHSSYIMAMDWCAESKYIRTNCGAYELLFFTVPDCNQDPSGRSNTTETTWATKTIKFFWDTEGIYPSGTDGTHINSVCGSPDGQMLATGDDYGLLNLFRDPCRAGHKPRSMRGHSEHVVRVMFGFDSGVAKDYLFSIGGYDQTLMQWKKC